MNKNSKRLIIEHILSQHAEESSFLWMLRDGAVSEPHYQLMDLEELETRIDAHLDGLRVAGDAAWRFCEAGLQHKEAGEVFTAVYTALDNSKLDWLDQVLNTVADTPECTRGIVSALGWSSKEKLQGYVVNWLKSRESMLRMLGLAACAIQRVDCGGYLKLGLEDADIIVRARALRSVGEIRRQDMLPAVVEQLASDDTDCQFWAAWAATMLGEAKGLRKLQEFYESSNQKFQQYALALGLRAMDKTAAVNWIREHTMRPGFARPIIEATGIVGDPVTIPWLISLMQKPEYSRLAGES
ncbi:MAG: TIGR02270 family protein, partial [Candidatus Thiodiazotropha sp.]